MSDIRQGETMSSKSSGLARFLPIVLIAAGAIAAFVLARDYLSFDALLANYEQLAAWRDDNLLLSIAVFAGIYMLCVAFSVPGAIWLTLIGGFMFGTVLGTAVVVFAATAGALAIFLAAKTALGDVLREKAGPWVARMEEGFRDGEISYLLIMRLVPAVPFFIANLAPAFLGARTWTFLWTTLVVIVPGTLVFISIGAGLEAQLARGEAPDLGVIFEWHILGPLLGLAALASLPLVLKSLGVIGANK
ncbi:MAG: VTT domain-containing protein [Pseudomonadota bacterium]